MTEATEPRAPLPPEQDQAGPDTLSPTGQPTGAPQAAVAQGGAYLTTAQGARLYDSDHSLKAGPRGPVLLQDHHLREKITHFDHERIPERVVHARGAAAHGVFQSYGTAGKVTKAAFLAKGVETPVFVPSSSRTRSSSPTSSTPESPTRTGRSRRPRAPTTPSGTSCPCTPRPPTTPKLGVHSLVWEEAQITSGTDPDFHRRDLADAIEAGAYPRWELGIQTFPDTPEQTFEGIDLLDPTKIVPEELAPVRPVGVMTLNANPARRGRSSVSGSNVRRTGKR